MSGFSDLRLSDYWQVLTADYKSQMDMAVKCTARKNRSNIAVPYHHSSYY